MYLATNQGFMKKILLPLLLILPLFLAAQPLPGNGPWNNPLRMAWSSDGITFGTSTIFQDSAGVPSVIRWKGDTLIAAFQWFRQPVNGPEWDKVATKISTDKGLTWSEPVPILVNGLPTGYQRPFDPTLVSLGGDSLRIYYSSSATMPAGLDSAINTYSAVSTDGIQFQFEPGPRVDVDTGRVIDPAVIYFNNSWHYAAPIGSPQQGAYHFISPNGVSFSRVPNIGSDNQHNWTGNYMVDSPNELRFYGSGAQIWLNRSSNGGVWTGYTPTNLQGGDPSVVKIDSGQYLIIFVGPPYATSREQTENAPNPCLLYPNPATTQLFLDCGTGATLAAPRLTLSDVQGKSITLTPDSKGCFSLRGFNLAPGVYHYQIIDQEKSLRSGKVLLE